MYTDTAHVDPPSPNAAPASSRHGTDEHRHLRHDDFWRQLPAYREVSADQFQTHLFQQKQTVTNVRQLRETVGELAPDSFYQDLEEGIRHAPMALRISPYLLSLIDRSDPISDPIRTQFLPLRSQQQPDHPMLKLDSLDEQGDSPVP